MVDIVKLEQQLLSATTVDDLKNLQLTEDVAARLSPEALDKVITLTNPPKPEERIKDITQDRDGLIGGTVEQFTSGFGSGASLPALAETGVRLALNKVGANVDIDETYLPDTNDFRNLSDFAGVPFAEVGDEPRGLLEHGAKIAGSTVSVGLMVYAGIKGLAAAPAAAVGSGVKASATNILATISANKGRYALAELAAIGGSAGGGEVAAGLFGEDARIAGEVVGAFTPAGVGAAINQSTQAASTVGGTTAGSRVGGKVAETVNDVRSRINPQAAPEIASGIVQSKVADPAAAANRLTQSVSPNTPAAALVDEPSFSKMTQGLASKNPEFSQEMAKQVDAAYIDFQNEFQKIAPTDRAGLQTLVAGVKSRADNINLKFDEGIDAAKESIRTTLDTLPAGGRLSQYSTVVKNHLEEAYQAARTTERELHRLIPKTETLPAVSLKNVLTRITDDGQVRKLLEAEKSAIPTDVKNVVKVLKKSKGGKVPVAEVMALRSAVLDNARAAGTAGNFNTQRILNNVSDNLLEVLDEAPSSEAITAAREYGRAMRSKFYDGDIGIILRTTGGGESIVPPEETLDRLIKMSKSGAGRSFDNIIEATGNPQTSLAVNNWVASKFVRAAVNEAEGTINLGKAETFMRNNQELLDRLPKLRNSISEMMKTQRAAERLIDRQKAFVNNLARKHSSVISRLLKAGEDTELKFLFQTENGQDAATQTAELMRAAKRTMGDGGVRAVQSTLLNRLLHTAKKGNEVNSMGGRIINGAALRSQLTQGISSRVYKEAFPDEHYQHLLAVADEIDRIQKLLATNPSVEGLYSKASPMLVNAARMMSLRAFEKTGLAPSGTGAIQANAIVSSSVGRTVSELNSDQAVNVVHRALLDRETLGQLFTPKGITKRAEKMATEIPQLDVKAKLQAGGLTAVSAIAQIERDIMEEYILTLPPDEYDELMGDE